MVSRLGLQGTGLSEAAVTLGATIWVGSASTTATTGVVRWQWLGFGQIVRHALTSLVASGASDGVICGVWGPLRRIFELCWHMDLE